MSNTFHGTDRVPIPPRDAAQFTTVCSYCIVGCGYRVFKWPQGKEGGPLPAHNALRVDFTSSNRPNREHGSTSWCFPMSGAWSIEAITRFGEAHTARSSMRRIVPPQTGSVIR